MGMPYCNLYYSACSLFLFKLLSLKAVDTLWPLLLFVTQEENTDHRCVFKATHSLRLLVAFTLRVHLSAQQHYEVLSDVLNYKAPCFVLQLVQGEIKNQTESIKIALSVLNP